MASAGDWGEIIDEAEAERFVGREQELESFRQHISLHKPRYLVFYITGQGGAGKSTLLHRYQEIAQEYSFLLADCDEQQRDVPAVLDRFAQQLSDQAFHLRDFNERYKTYRQKMHEIESDPEAPQGLATTLVRTVVRAGFIVGDAIPGMRRGLEYVPREAIETQASEWVTYLAKKFTNKDDMALVREPVAVLTPLFFGDLNKIVEKRKVLLCFDNFEATRPELHEWLLHLPEYKPSFNIRIAIAGRNLPGARWDPLQKVTQTIHLDVFTEQEAQAFLNAYNITNVKRRQEILELSGRLPVLMSWLAAIGQEGEMDTSIPTHDIVERFLRWIRDPALRQVALLAAISRTFNIDILKTLLQDQQSEIDEQSAFDWLQTMPFVQQRSDGWHYHDVVRRMMLHYQRQKSPQWYRQRHAALAAFYDISRQESGAANSAEDKHWVSEEWQKDTLAYVYHFLAANPQKHWDQILSLFVVAIRKHRAFALEMIELLNSEDNHDELTHKHHEAAQFFYQKVQAIEEGTLKDGFEMFDWLCRMDGLSAQAKGYAFAYRGECYRLNKRWEQAFRDFDEALQFIPEDAWTLASRGATYHRMARHQEALADFDRAIALDDEYTWAIALRGETHRHLDHYQEALADFDRAISLNETDARTFVLRGETHYLMGHCQEALADLNHAIFLNESNAGAFALRGANYRQMGRYQEALADFDQAISLDENYVWAIAHRGQTCLQMGRYHEALADLDHAISLDENSSWIVATRGGIYRLMDRYEEALSDFGRAIALDEKYSWTYVRRGEIYRLTGRYQEALTDFDCAIALDDKYSLALGSRGQTYHQMGRYQEALTDFDRAIELDERYVWAIAHRGMTYRQMGRYQEAIVDFDRAIELDPAREWVIDERASTYVLTDSHQEDFALANNAITINEQDNRTN